MSRHAEGREVLHPYVEGFVVVHRHEEDPPSAHRTVPDLLLVGVPT